LNYEKPVLLRPGELYETPMLLDLEEVTSAETPCCDTGGGTCNPKPV
jgi:hypothetical protein